MYKDKKAAGVFGWRMDNDCVLKTKSGGLGYPTYKYTLEIAEKMGLTHVDLMA